MIRLYGYIFPFLCSIWSRLSARRLEKEKYELVAEQEKSEETQEKALPGVDLVAVFIQLLQVKANAMKPDSL